MKKHLTMLLACLFLSIGVALAQTQINGTVVSESDGEPIVGATVRVVGHNTGTATDIDGKFKITMPVGATKIIVSYVGMKSQELVARNNMRVVLQSESKAIDEVFVVAYGTAKKSSFTGSAVSVDSKKIDKMQTADAAKALEGMVAGLAVTSSSGRAGTSATIRIRGIGSLNASSSPLIILDGAPYESEINSINPKDIENISVLKDAASAALYGARGANGVILITTKSGQKGKLQVSFDARIGSNRRGVPEYDVISDPGTYYRLTWESLKNRQIYSNKPAANPAEWASNNLIETLGYNIYNTPDNQVVDANGNLTTAPIKYEDAGSFNNWTGQLYKPHTRQEYTLSLSKGTDKSRVYFSVGYLDDLGFSIKSDFKRLSNRLAYESQFTDWLKLSASSQLSRTETRNSADERNNFSNVFMWTRMIAPIYPIYKHNSAGKIVRDANGNPLYDDTLGRPYAGGTNLIKQLELNDIQHNQFFVTENVRADIKLPYGFNFNTTGTFSGNWWTHTDFKNPLVGDGQAYGGILEKWSSSNYSLNWNQVLTWDGTFDKFTLHGMLGHEYYQQKFEYLYGTKQTLLDPTLKEFINAAKTTELNSYTRDYRVEGWFGQATADYDNKYYVSASLRYDGSSVFHPDHRWGTFWSLGASWRINQEKFMENLTFIDNLKLRVSYGVQGNDYLLLPGSTTRAYTPYTNLYSIGTTGTSSTYSPTYKGNKEITWEKNHNLDVGIEFSLWNGKLSGELEVFNRLTTDMLFNLPIPSTTGFSTQPVNFGKMTNKGFEFTLSSNVYSDKNINVNVSVNGTTYRNKIKELPEEFRKDGIVSGYRLIKEGGSIYDYWMIKSAGVDEKTGDALYYMYDEDTKTFVAKPSKFYSTDNINKQYVGSAIPKLAGGFSLSAVAYGFDFSAQFAYRIGGKFLDLGYQNLMSAGTAGTNWHKDILNRWTPENTKTDVPRLQNANQGLIQSSDRFIIDASYLALTNLTFGYTLPSNWVNRAGLQTVRVYFAADNLGFFSKRKGLDPRTSVSGTQDYSVNSAVRTLSLGLTVSL